MYFQILCWDTHDDGMIASLTKTLNKIGKKLNIFKEH